MRKQAQERLNSKVSRLIRKMNEDKETSPLAKKEMATMSNKLPSPADSVHREQQKLKKLNTKSSLVCVDFPMIVHNSNHHDKIRYEAVYLHCYI